MTYEEFKASYSASYSQAVREPSLVIGGLIQPNAHIENMVALAEAYPDFEDRLYDEAIRDNI